MARSEGQTGPTRRRKGPSPSWIGTRASAGRSRARKSSSRPTPTARMNETDPARCPSLAELQKLDEVAYIRFASVYRRFQDLNEFREEIERLAREPAKE